MPINKNNIEKTSVKFIKNIENNISGRSDNIIKFTPLPFSVNSLKNSPLLALMISNFLFYVVKNHINIT